MRQTILGAFLIAALLLIPGCGRDTAPDGFSEEDCYLRIEGSEYRCDDDIETVVTALGLDYSYAEGLSCAYDSVDKTFTYELASFYTNPLPEGDLVSEIYTENPAVSTSAGVTAGMRREDVLKAHGEDCEEMGGLLIYRVPGAEGKPGRGALCFELEGNEVIAIFVTTEPI